MMNRYDDRIPSETALKRLRPTVADGLLLAVLITAVSINLFSSLAATRHDGGSIVISADDRSDNTLSLEKDGRWSIAGPLGDSLIEIKDHRARFIQSPCPKKICLHFGWLRYAGDFAACLPNHISIQVTGQRYDSINY